MAAPELATVTSIVAVEPLPARFVTIPPEHAFQVFDTVSEMLEKPVAMCEGRIELEDVRALLENGHFTLHVFWDEEARAPLAAVVTAFQDYARKRVLEIHFCGGGHMERWKHHIKSIEDWAKLNGASQVDIYGRPGWGRVLGYPERYRVFGISLEGDDDGD